MSAKSEDSHVSDSKQNCTVLNPLLKVILEGMYDEDCILSKFRGCPHIVRKIWIDVKNFWKAKIILPLVPSTIEGSAIPRWKLYSEYKSSYGGISF